MKLIEALKKIKDLKRKADDIKDKVAKHCVDLDCESPVYPDQRRQVSEWLQSYGDIIKEIGHLKTSIQRTNLNTAVTIELGGKFVTKCISAWIDRRKELASLDEQVWRVLTDKNYQEQYRNKPTPASPETLIKIRRYYDPSERDQKIELFRSEPSKINATLEIINATTDLIEA